MDKIDFEQYLENIPKPQMQAEQDTASQLDTDDVWKIVTENLKMVLDRVEYDSWFDGTYLENIQNGVAVISCSNEFKRQTILRDYSKFLQSCLTKATGQNFQIEIIVKADNTQKEKERYKFVKKDTTQPVDLFSDMESKQKKYVEASINANLNPRYTFNNFVVGASNRLAEAVAQSVVSDIEKGGGAKTYNPVFYYGRSGVGKTHLMQAIGNEVLKDNPSKKVVYIPIEQFLNEMIETIRTKKNEEFRNKYRQVDLLIIDDIQFVETYPKTQEELFHTFNALYQANKQIVLASDRAPKDIKNITDRLRTRFEGGMVCDIQPPEYETRLAILQLIAMEKRVPISKDILILIAKNIENSVRELEGALNKVITLVRLGMEPSYDDVARFLQIDIESKRKRVTPEKVINVVSEVFDIPVNMIKGQKRTSDIAQARQVVMYLLRTQLELPLCTIANAVGRKDHTTVIYGCETIEKKIQKDSSFAERVEKCRTQLFV
ncbi:MAG TPA: chromosomal replication initiator protein DnaA [Candidatus Dojkabacteria bacterium]|nr:chromosomal replication initiator protein DnaA [Candidatus Dojkabacteria bacterium]